MTTAREVPEIRARLAAWLAEPGPSGGRATYARIYAQELDRTRVDDPVGAGAQQADRLTRRVRAAEMYYVSGEMVALARAAGRSMPDYRLHHEDIPSPVGLCAFAEPIVRLRHPMLTTLVRGDLAVPISMVTWGPQGPGVAVDLWATTDDLLDAMTTVARRPFTVAQRQSMHASHAGGWVVMATSVLPYTHITHSWVRRPDPDGVEEQEDGERTVVAAWLLMGQTLAGREEVSAPRSAARRIARAGGDPAATVRYVQLRRARAESAEDGQPGGRGRTYRHQWVVRGHWRRQWYPSRGDHRPIWISDHIAGPEGAPLIGGERVNVLRR